jgi:UDP-N-acetylglucosamine--N-acetylmuramyl-(pentapeptide) pyrophosphoryl-undecaprenol N-acetylglucosamine transferase
MSRRRRHTSGSVHLIGSLGGHLELLHAAAPALARLDQTWITSEGARAASLRAEGKRVRTLPRLDRGTLGVSAIWAGIVLALRERPRLVVTSGAGLAVPFAVVSRALGARIVFLETMARVRTGSLSGRLLARLGATVLVQWPELRGTYPRAVVCRPLLLEDLPELRAGGVGTFVTVGSHDVGFDRMLAAVDQAAGEGLLPHPVHVQRGVSTYTPEHGTFVDFVSPEEFASRVAGAAVVVTHGGAGAIGTALRAGRRPLVFARDPARGEHVDAHQRELVDRLSELGLVVPVAQGTVTAQEVAAALQPGGAGALAALADLPPVTTALAEVLFPQDGHRAGPVGSNVA